MKRIITALLLAAAVLTSLSGCDIDVRFDDEVTSALGEVQSELDEAKKDIEDAKKDIDSGLKDAQSAIDDSLGGKSSSSKSDSKTSSNNSSSKADGKSSNSSSSKSDSGSFKTYTMADIEKLKGTGNFADNALEHIFDGTINKKGEATGYHYDPVTDSKGSIIKGTKSEPDDHGVYTAKVKVSGKKKNGFSSFYPDDWTPQQVVDAINQAYDDALSDTSNPHGELWIGYAGDLEIDMYLTNKKKIITAYPIYEED